MNYSSKTLKIYKRMNLNEWLDKSIIDNVIQKLKNGFAGKSVSIC
jgi:hypothetical protein